jgi:amino acid transporter
MMNTSALLASSRQAFAFARDGALPLTNILQLDKVNSWTKTPVNTVWYSVFWAGLMGCLVFIGE